jgi:hypothetical protein
VGFLCGLTVENKTMQFPKRNKSNRYILDAAKRVYDSGIVIDWDSAFSTVSIDDTNDKDNSIFMQGEEADQFIAEIEALTKRFRTMDEYIAALALAEPYVECLFN